MIRSSLFVDYEKPKESLSSSYDLLIDCINEINDMTKRLRILSKPCCWSTTPPPVKPKRKIIDEKDYHQQQQSNDGNIS